MFNQDFRFNQDPLFKQDPGFNQDLGRDRGQSPRPQPALAKTGPTTARPAKHILHALTPGETIKLSGGATNRLTGTAAEPIHRIRSGCVAFYQLLSDGRRQITDILGPGRCFSIVSPRKDGVFVKTLTYTNIETLDATANPALAQEANLSALARLTRHATLLGRMTAAERIATALFDLAAQFPRKMRSDSNANPTLMLYLSRADLADWLGLTVETVSRIFNQLKRAGLIAFSHTEIVTICNPSQLAAIAGGTRISDITAKQGRKPFHAVS